MTEIELKKMKLHEMKIVSIEPNSTIAVLRVIGGWIYSYHVADAATSIVSSVGIRKNNVSTVFVPE